MPLPLPDLLPRGKRQALAFHHMSHFTTPHMISNTPLSLPREAMVQLEPPVVWTQHTPAGCHFHSRTCCTSGSSLPTCPRTYFILPLAPHIRGYPIWSGGSNDISLVEKCCNNQLSNLLSQDSIHISKAQRRHFHSSIVEMTGKFGGHLQSSIKNIWKLKMLARNIQVKVKFS